MQLHQVSDQDRLQLLRLSYQVEEIANRLERMERVHTASAASLSSGSFIAQETFPFEGPNRDFRDQEIENDCELRRRASRPALPDPRLIRRIIRQRQMRARYFSHDLFADPAWDMLLDLTAARAEHKRVSVTSLCIASCVPPTTALRWIGEMKEAGLVERIDDETDRRRAFIALSDRAADAIARYFAELGHSAALSV